jgi:alkanesulfonate monooxygenase SsuD/methylene tetrahydromethanopterin reductase-like flavin-dependent oxidoreductase (luciferase family)
MPYLYSAERYVESVRVITETAAQIGRSLDGFRWMAYVMVAVDDRPLMARRAAAEFLGGTYDQDFSQFVDRVTVTGDLDQVADGLRAFGQAGVEHLVLLPCSGSHSTTVAPWLPDLVAKLQGHPAPGG